MRFYEYEAKELFKRHGMPLGQSTVVANAAEDARAAFAKHRRNPVVLKSQVLSGGRMKAGAVKFADTPDEAARDSKRSSRSKSTARTRARSSSRRRARSHRNTSSRSPGTAAPSAGLLFSDMGGIDIEEVAETHPEHVSKTHFSTILPLTPRIAKEAVGATGVTGSALNKLTPIVFKLMRSSSNTT